MPNPDGTVQVSPPRQSAFGPASASAPPPPAAPVAQATPGSPGFSGAIDNIVRMLMEFIGPKAIMQHKALLNGQVNAATGTPGVQGIQQQPGGLGTGPSGLGQ
jgi:hypothetical protein